MWVAAAAVLTYGYEVFNFHLSLDETVVAPGGRRHTLEVWTSQGRWGNGLVDALLPATVVPVVTTALGVALMAVAFYRLARRSGGLRPIEAAMAAAVAVSLPVQAFIMSWSTLALGIGIAYLLVVIACEVMHKPTLRGCVVATLCGGFAFAVYEPFAFTLVSVAGLSLWRRPTWTRASLWSAVVVVSISWSTAMLYAMRRLLNVPSGDSYRAGKVDFGALITRPETVWPEALDRVKDVVSLSYQIYGREAPWLALLVGVVVLTAFLTSLTSPSHRAGRTLLVLGLCAIPITATAIALPGDLRSMVYLPIVLVCLISIAAPTVRAFVAHMPRLEWGVIGLVVLAAVSSAIITNSAFASAESALAHDRFIAFRIGEEIQRLVPQDELPVEIHITGQPEFTSGPVTPEVEHFGLSLMSGEDWRALTFLASQGIPIKDGNTESAIAPAALPPYPKEGWVTYRDGVLLVNLGEWSD